MTGQQQNGTTLVIYGCLSWPSFLGSNNYDERRGFGFCPHLKLTKGLFMGTHEEKAAVVVLAGVFDHEHLCVNLMHVRDIRDAVN